MAIFGSGTLLKEFKSASWATPEEANAFVDAAGEVDPQELSRLLKTLLGRKAGDDVRTHQLRCRVFQLLAQRNPRPALFAPLVEALGEGDRILRKTAAELLPIVDDPQQHAALADLLHSQSPEIRRDAAAAAAAVAKGNLYKGLIKWCERKDFRGRDEAMQLLVDGLGHGAVPALRGIMEHGTAREKRKALSHLGDRERMARARKAAADVVAAALEDEAETVRVDAISALARVADERSFLERVLPLLDSARTEVAEAALQALGNFASTNVIGLLEARLRAGSPRTQQAVLDVLERIALRGSEERAEQEAEGEDEGSLIAWRVADTVATALDDPNDAVRARAASVLEELAASGGSEPARVVVWLLRSRSPDVQGRARALAERTAGSNEEFWPRVLHAVAEEEWRVRDRMAPLLVDMAGAGLTRHVTLYLRDVSPIIRRFGVDLLMRIGDHQSVGVLHRTAHADPDWWVGERAVEALGAVGGDRAITAILDIVKKHEQLRPVAVETFGELGDRRVARHVASLLQGADPELQTMILDCLESLDEPECAPRLTAVGEKLHPSVKAKARILMGRWTAGEATPATAQRSPLDRVLLAAVSAEAQDVLLFSGERVRIKKLGGMEALSREPFTDERVRRLILPHLMPAARRQLESQGDVELSYEIDGDGHRFRVNVFEREGGLASVFRHLPESVPDWDSLGLPDSVSSLCDHRHGLVIVGGPSGSGKSTTLAALLDRINRKLALHIITVEDPVEFRHGSLKSLVNQREVGTHTGGYAQALRAALREDPDVIVIGELRDQETISLAVSAAETGHLVFGTMHTVSAESTIDRLTTAFPPAQQHQARAILAGALRGVVCQKLIPAKQGEERVAAAEVMVNTHSIANLIRKGRLFQIPSVIATSRPQGMRTMDGELIRLVREDLITAEDAYLRAENAADMEAMLSGKAVEVPEMTPAQVDEAFASAIADPSEAAPGEVTPSPPDEGSAA